MKADRVTIAHNARNKHLVIRIEKRDGTIDHTEIRECGEVIFRIVTGESHELNLGLPFGKDKT